MAAMWFDPDADAALAALENDPARGVLARRINTVLDRLESDPGDARVRRHRFYRPALWCVTVGTDDEEWAVLWEPHPSRAGDVIVHYIGPASFS